MSENLICSRMACYQKASWGYKKVENYRMETCIYSSLWHKKWKHLSIYIENSDIEVQII